MTTMDQPNKCMGERVRIHMECVAQWLQLRGCKEQLLKEQKGGFVTIAILMLGAGVIQVCRGIELEHAA